MAAPPHKTLHNLSGKWTLNKSLSDSISPILALQGTNTLLRNAIASASVTLEISQPNNNEYHVHQSATAASIPGTTEQYILDNEWRKNKDAFFGEVDGRARWVGVEEAKGMEGVKGEWEEGQAELVLAEGGKEGEWSAVRIWGFEGVGEERRYVQRVWVRGEKGGEERVRMAYDFVEE